MIPASADDGIMAESTSATSQTNTSPLTGPSSFGSAFDAQGLPTVHEVAHHKTSHDFNSMDYRLRSMIQPSGGSGGSRNGSAGSSIGRSFDDKLLEAPPLPYGYSAQASAAPKSHQSFEENPGTMTNGNGHHQEPPKVEQHHKRLSKANAARREKKGGFRNTIRRILGMQRSPKDRISMPNPPMYPRHVRFCLITTPLQAADRIKESRRVHHFCYRCRCQATALSLRTRQLPTTAERSQLSPAIKTHCCSCYCCCQ